MYVVREPRGLLRRPCKLKGWRARRVPRRTQSSLGPASPTIGVRPEKAGAVWVPWVSLHPSTSRLWFPVPVKRVPWAQAVGRFGWCLDCRLYDPPGRMWLSLGERWSPTPPLQPLLSLRLLPPGILRKGLQEVAPVNCGLRRRCTLAGGGGTMCVGVRRQLCQNGARESSYCFFVQGSPTLI